MKIQGGDKVLLKNGKIVTVEDIKNDYIVVSCVEWYNKDDIEKIVEKMRK